MLESVTSYVVRSDRTGTVHVESRAGAFDATFVARGEDFRVKITVDGATYAMGRSNGASWRRTPTGTVRVIRSDVQSDDLDRWPRSVFGFYTHDCAAAGRSGSLWVLYCRAPGDIAHYYYIDPAAKFIVREVTREGAHVVDFAFDPSSSSGWHASGYGPDERVTIGPVSHVAVAANDLAIPASLPGQFALPEGLTTIPIACDVVRSRIVVPVTIAGKLFHFAIDTGTSQILMNAASASSAGLHAFFGHVIASDVRVGGAVASRLSIETVGELPGVDGLLGNEFFTGHIVHLDYRHCRMELIPSSRFSPPPGLSAIPMDASEGIPLVPVVVNGTAGSRFALDTAGAVSLLSADFSMKMDAPNDGERGQIYYLEGSLGAHATRVSTLQLGPYDFLNIVMGAIDDNPANVDFPLDGILGTGFLRNFEWWFDYDNQRVWVEER